MKINCKFINNQTFNYPQGTFFKMVENSGSFYQWELIGEDIIFTTDFIACPRIAYAFKDNNFIFDFGREGIINFVKSSYPDDYLKKELEEEYASMFKSSREDYLYNHVNYIENWSKVIIHKDGSFEKEDYPLELFSVDLKDAYDIVYELVKKYKNLVKNLVEQDRFIPTITGGLDTRALSGIWRPYYKGDSFFCLDCKNDGKNQIELGEADLQCAIKVAEKLGLHNRTNTRGDFKTLSGMYSLEYSFCKYQNRPDYIFKVIQHGTRWSGNLRPYADDLYFKIRHPKQGVFRLLMLSILAPDLIELDCIGTKYLFEKHGGQPYKVLEHYADIINDVKEIMDYWGKEKCQALREIK